MTQPLYIASAAATAAEDNDYSDDYEPEPVVIKKVAKTVIHKKTSYISSVLRGGCPLSIIDYVGGLIYVTIICNQQIMSSIATGAPSSSERNAASITFITLISCL